MMKNKYYSKIILSSLIIIGFFSFGTKNIFADTGALSKVTSNPSDGPEVGLCVKEYTNDLTGAKRQISSDNTYKTACVADTITHPTGGNETGKVISYTMQGYLKEAATISHNIIDGVDTTCGLFNPAGCAMKVVGWIALTMMRLFSLVALLAGGLLNYVVIYTIAEMSKHYGDISAIKESWATIRDLANMCFIFVLLYAAIQKIIGEGKDTNKLIVNMIIAALLMNFSLFFTSLIIDASNLLALTFYKAIVTNFSTTDYLSTGLSNALMKPLNLTTIWKISDNFTGTNLITIGILGSVFILITTFVFLAMSLMFIIRYVSLIFVLILSPIFVVSTILPKAIGGEQASAWKNALLNQSFFAPVFMILMWIVVKIFNSCGFMLATVHATGGGTVCTQPGDVSFGNAITNTAGTAGAAGTASAASGIAVHAGADNLSLIMNFIVIISFLIMALYISKSISDKSSGVVASLNKTARGFAGDKTFGFVAQRGRNIIGSRADAMLKDEKLQEKARNGDMAARLQLQAASKASKASFDLRGSAIGSNLDGGKAKSGGFAQDQKDREKLFGSMKPKDSRAKMADEKIADAEKAATEAKRDAKTTETDAGNAAAETIKNTQSLNENEIIDERAGRVGDINEADFADSPEQKAHKAAEEALKLAEENAPLDNAGEPMETAEITKLREVRDKTKKEYEEMVAQIKPGMKDATVREVSRQANITKEEAVGKAKEAVKIAESNLAQEKAAKEEIISESEQAARIEEGALINEVGQYIDREGNVIEGEIKMSKIELEKAEKELAEQEHKFTEAYMVGNTEMAAAARAETVRLKDSIKTMKKNGAKPIKTWERRVESFIMGGKLNAQAFRSAGKEKTEDQKMLEAIKAAAKKEADAAAKKAADDASGGGGAPKP